jgi:hypothetical protein
MLGDPLDLDPDMFLRRSGIAATRVRRRTARLPDRRDRLDDRDRDYRRWDEFLDFGYDVAVSMEQCPICRLATMGT